MVADKKSQAQGGGSASVGSCNCDSQSSQLSPKSLAPGRPSFVPNKPLYNDNVIIFLITPTYTRPTQMPDMTRLAQTLRLVPDIFWIVVEDAQVMSKYVPAARACRLFSESNAFLSLQIGGRVTAAKWRSLRASPRASSAHTYGQT